MHRVELMGLGTADGASVLMLLRTEDGERVVPIGIGPNEASAIVMRLQGFQPERPLTHDLLSSVVSQTGAEVTRVEITELRDHAFHALITLATPAGEVGLDARPSDAVALAMRTDAPIFASDQVIADGSVELPDDNPEELVDEFRAFLDGVNADDFAAADENEDSTATD